MIKKLASKIRMMHLCNKRSGRCASGTTKIYGQTYLIIVYSWGEYEMSPVGSIFSNHPRRGWVVDL